MRHFFRDIPLTQMSGLWRHAMSMRRIGERFGNRRTLQRLHGVLDSGSGKCDIVSGCGLRIRYLWKKAGIGGGYGSRVRYLVKTEPIRVVLGQIAERLSVSSAKWRQNGKIAERVSVTP